MRLFAGNENSLLPVSVPLIQSFVETEDVLNAMRKYIKPDGFIENMFIEFENTKIPICSQHECRIVAHMAAAYHNSCLAKTLSSEKDLYGNAYTPQNTQSTLVRKMKSFGVDAEWIPGQEQAIRGK